MHETAEKDNYNNHQKGKEKVTQEKPKQCNNKIEQKTKSQKVQELAPRITWSEYQARENKSSRSQHLGLVGAKHQTIGKLQEKIY